MRRILLAASVALFLSCSGKTHTTADAGHDVSTDTGPVSDLGTDASTTDAGADAALDAGRCPDAPPCDRGQHYVDCKCVSNFDRKCVTDADCRPGEECKEVEGYQLCWYTAKPVRACPGSAGCTGQGDGVVYAAAVSKVVTPDGFEAPKPAGVDDDNYLNFSGTGGAPDDKWYDCGIDGLCPGDPGYPGPDEGENDDKLQGMWIAGFGNGRPAQYCPAEKIGCSEPDCCVSKFAHDDLHSQIVVLRVNDVTVAFVALDAVGFFHDDIERIRKRISEDAGIDLLIMGSSHTHEAPDTSGQWGPGDPAPMETGRQDAHMEKIYSQTVAGIEEAVDNLEPVDVSAGIISDGIDGLAMTDTRTPYIVDDNIPVVHLTSKATGDTVATMLSVGNHAEALWSSNPYISSDYFHFTRKYVREGLEATTDVDTGDPKAALQGTDGVVVMFAGAVGGLLTPGHGGAKDYAGNPAPERGFVTADAVGQSIAARVLGAIDGGKLESLQPTDLRFGTKEWLQDIRNRQLVLAGFALGLIPRATYNVTGTPAAFHPGDPYLLTQTAVVKLGDVTFFTAPGEAFPELLVGGYPNRPSVQDPVIGDVEEHHTPSTCDDQGLPTPNDDGTHACIVTKDQENPPDWSQAPQPPYGYDMVPGKYPFFIGLGMDFLGYMVPPYDYEEVGFFTAAPGDHYEETNGVSVTIVDNWRTHLQESIDAMEAATP